MNNKIWVPMAVGAGIGYLRKKTPRATIVGGLSGIGVGIVMNWLKLDPGLSARAGFKREEYDREGQLPNFDFESIPIYTGRVKYY